MALRADDPPVHANAPRNYANCKVSRGGVGREEVSGWIKFAPWGGCARARAQVTLSAAPRRTPASWYHCERRHACSEHASAVSRRSASLFSPPGFIPTTGAQAHKGAHILYVGWHTGSFTVQEGAGSISTSTQRKIRSHKVATCESPHPPHKVKTCLGRSLSCSRGKEQPSLATRSLLHPRLRAHLVHE